MVRHALNNGELLTKTPNWPIKFQDAPGISVFPVKFRKRKLRNYDVRRMIVFLQLVCVLYKCELEMKPCYDQVTGYCVGSSEKLCSVCEHAGTV